MNDTKTRTSVLTDAQVYALARQMTKYVDEERKKKRKDTRSAGLKTIEKDPMYKDLVKALTLISKHRYDNYGSLDNIKRTVVTYVCNQRGLAQPQTTYVNMNEIQDDIIVACIGKTEEERTSIVEEVKEIVRKKYLS
jgi:hypothetical protein